MNKEYLSSTDEVIQAQATSADSGLSSEEAKARLETCGRNELDKEEKTPLWKRFFQQMADPMVIMLLVAAVISALTGIIQGEPDIADVVIILFVVVVNSILGVVQESKSEQALEALQEMSAAQSKVIRDGKFATMASAELVPGDIVVLEAGDSVPADCRIIESASLKIEESALTGESVPVEKHTDPITLAPDTEDVPLGDRKNMCYMGSTVVYGRGKAVVISTGMRTEMGKIAGALKTAEKEQTPLQVKLAELSKVLTVLVIVICIVIFAVDIIRNFSELSSNPALILDTFMVAVSLAVAAIPEGLVAVVTIVLSMGVTKMAKKNAIVRKLSAVETLGCTQIICSDKTGTLTQNKMTVVRHAAEDEALLVKTMALCSDAEWDTEQNEAKGEPTEAALVADAAKTGTPKTTLDTENVRIDEAPFDSGRKMMSVVCKSSDGVITQYTKGAPDVILNCCTKIQTADGVVPLTDALRAKVMEQNKAMADDALRVLAAAVRDWGTTAPESNQAAFLEQDLTFVGLSGMIDPVRPEVGQSIIDAREAGIRTVMITGDHIDTAIAIAKELGIIEDASQAITGAELDKLSDEEFKEKVVEYNVYARVQPEHKTRIVDAWKSRGNIVAMTGDGVNDAPSIKRADIGIGMGITGTDVTKNVADMVLADDNFATIISAVEEGRRVYDNIRKVIQMLLSANLAEVFVVFVATLCGFTIFEPVQLLWINLITDCFPALALGTEEAEGDVMKRKPRKASDGVFADHMGIDCVVQGVVIGALVFISFLIGFHLEAGSFNILANLENTVALMEGTTMAFVTLSMTELFHSLNMRSRRNSLFTMKKQNKWLWGAVVLALILTTVVVEIPPLAEVFGFMELDLIHYVYSLILAVLIIPINEIYKAIMRAVEKDK